MSLPTAAPLHTLGALGGCGAAAAVATHAPGALSSAISCGMVVAGYSDGEVRMWHTETLAALHSQGLSREPSEVDSKALNSILESMPAVAAAAAGDAAEAAAAGAALGSGGGAVAVVAFAASASKRPSLDSGAGGDGLPSGAATSGLSASLGTAAAAVAAAVRSREHQMEQCLRDFVRIRTVSVLHHRFKDKKSGNKRRIN